MKKVFSVIFILLIIFILTLFSQASGNENFEQARMRKGTVDLVEMGYASSSNVCITGEWETYSKQLLNPAELQSYPQRKKIYSNLSVENEYELNELVTYRGLIRVTDNKLYTLDISLLSPYNSKTWINGKCVYGNQFLDVDLYNKYGLRDITVKDLTTIWTGEAKNGYIEVVVQTSIFGASKGMQCLIYDANTLQKKKHTTEAGYTAIVGALAIIAIYHIIYYMLRKNEEASFYFAGICLSACTLIIFNNHLDLMAINAWHDYSYQFVFFVRCLSLVGMIFFGGLFTNSLYPGEAMKGVTRVLNLILGIWTVALIIIYLNTDMRSKFDIIDFVYFIVISYVIYYCIVTIRAIRNKRDGAILFFLSFISTALIAIHDVLIDLGRMNGQYLYYYGVLILVICMSAILAEKFSLVFSRLQITANQLRTSHNALESKNIELGKMWEDIKQSRDELAELNENLERIVEKRTDTIKNLLDNAGQGFLSLKKDLLIQEEYSLECERIFKVKLSNARFVDFIAVNKKDREVYENILRKIMATGERRNVFISLLPTEIQVYDRIIDLSYKFIASDKNKEDSEDRLMVILTDVTDKYMLEKQLELKRKNLEMIVRIIGNKNQFEECINDYNKFCDIDFKRIINSEVSDDQKLSELLRAIHTLKGNFSQYEMSGLIEKLHEKEEELLSFDTTETVIVDFNFLVNTKEMKTWLSEELDALSEILGMDYFKKEDTITITDHQMSAFEERLRAAADNKKLDVILKDFKKLRYKSIREMLQRYSYYINKMSEKLEKNVEYDLIGEDILVDAKCINNFMKSLVHVFRNAVDHGIETIEERYEAGKSEIGLITCSLIKEKAEIIIKISDDGRGLDMNAIKKKAIKMGIVDEKTLNRLNKDDIIHLIFHDEFSTSEEVTQLSGRGVGLAAVRAELEKLNGKVTVVSEQGVGTSFIFSIPYVE